MCPSQLLARVCRAGEATGLELCTSVLELLQWKADIQDEAELLAPLTQVLQQLLSSFIQSGQTPSAGPSVSVMDTSDDGGGDDNDDESSSDTEDGAEQPSLQRFVASQAWAPSFSAKSCSQYGVTSESVDIGTAASLRFSIAPWLHSSSVVLSTCDRPASLVTLPRPPVTLPPTLMTCCTWPGLHIHV